MSLQPALTDGGYISDRGNKSCNQLAALSTQQHFGLYMLTFLHSTRSYLPVTTTAWITRVFFIWSLSCDDMRGKDKWRRYSLPFQPPGRKEKHTSGHWLCGAEQQIWFEGKQKVVFWWDLSLARSWLLCKDLLFCCKDTRGSQRLPLPGMISKWSPARPPVDSIQSVVCVIVFLLFISRRKYSGDEGQCKVKVRNFILIVHNTSKGNIVLLSTPHLCPTL